MTLLSGMSDKERKKFIDSLLSTPVKMPIYPSPIRHSRNFSWENSYIKSEVDEQGNIYGYKVLIWDAQEERFQSPVYSQRWEREGFLESDKEPTENSKHGIYFLKSLYDPELDDYYRNIELRTTRDYYRWKYGDMLYVFIVRCILSGVIVEAERGFRSQYAKIEGVVHNGNWKTYQDFQSEAQYYNRTRYQSESYETTRYTDNYRTYITGAWNTSTKLAGQDEDPTESGS